jgi:pyruvate formate lyase activating enzyme
MFSKSDSYRREARLYETEDDGRVRCFLCAHHCRIHEHKFGICNVRQNIDGKLYTLVYGRAIAEHTDPIEKKPLYHFYPGSTSYSIATPGCNFHCGWCQNWQIAHLPRYQPLPTGRQLPPEQVVATAQRQGCKSIAYTYTEPTIFFEYALDTANLAHEAGIANVFVTNGFMTNEMLDAFPTLDAANVDLKSFRDSTYKRQTKARLQPVLDSMKSMKQRGIWLEVTTLLIPNVNDSSEELRDIATFIAGELGPETPWHISRYFPNYKVTDQPITPVETLHEAMEIGQAAGLQYIYMGNVRGENGRDTRCPNCDHTLIQRQGYVIRSQQIQNGRCPNCDTVIAGVGL